MNTTNIVRAALVAACLSFTSCGVLTGNISELYVPLTEDDDEQVILIAGETASVPGLADFTIDDPIPYKLVQEGLESMVYTNEHGHKLEFKRTYMEGTDQWIESVIFHTDSDQVEMVRFKYVADERGKAYGPVF
jgi:hypothetical protein